MIWDGNMSKTMIISLGVLIYLVTMGLIVLALNFINRRNRKKFGEAIGELEREKNLILGANIVTELNKVEALINNDILQEKLNN
jgi:hypothetical protein